MGDGGRRDLSLADVISLTGLDKNKVRALADAGYLKVWRPPATGPGTSHRRFYEWSVRQLVEIMEQPDGPAKDTAMEDLKRRNRGEVEQ